MDCISVLSEDVEPHRRGIGDSLSAASELEPFPTIRSHLMTLRHAPGGRDNDLSS